MRERKSCEYTKHTGKEPVGFCLLSLSLSQRLLRGVRHKGSERKVSTRFSPNIKEQWALEIQRDTSKKALGVNSKGGNHSIGRRITRASSLPHITTPFSPTATLAKNTGQ